MQKIILKLKDYILITINILSLFCLCTVVAHAAIDKVVLFGDSLSDDGNLFVMNGKMFPPPPYYKGRFSNGTVWIENLAGLLKLKRESHQILNDCASMQQFSNCAIGGALVINDKVEDGSDETMRVLDMLGQIQLYDSRTQHEQKDAHLFVLWGGGNDYLGALMSDQSTKVVTDKVISAYRMEVDLLIASGAKNFLILDLPDVGKTPLARGLGDGAVKKLSELSAVHNQKIAEMVAQEKSEHPNIKFTLFEASTEFKEIMTHPKVYHFKNVKDACLNVIPCKDPDAYLFWDELHPTKRVHELLAGLIFAALK